MLRNTIYKSFIEEEKAGRAFTLFEWRESFKEWQQKVLSDTVYADSREVSNLNDSARLD